ncbi:hypothetical protein SAMN05421786_104250 [Chryseobacterium ureilyticum]|uniref:HNH endonuclease n=1 Tax=Chryseobacterium ureilyticum TaxID=373668 RepID=A0A1N7P0C2_9FLAO|nr:hypothetical protein [Chryseobacterium ureilyticum]SIT04085.1 hypothetical protein SAMN05421786_104250 [Chryseobacterium ureilyticum]
MIYTEDELNTIKQAISEGGDIWNNKILTPLKRKIKDYYRKKGKEQCCYCKRDFENEFNMIIDIEHILPKSHLLFKDYMFEIKNLNISCKRCNMNIKKDRTDFIVDISTIKPDYHISNKYHFIHPNFDSYFEHISYNIHIIDDKKLIKYITKTEKGNYTYKYFLLDKIEIDTLSTAQGVKSNNIELNPDLPAEIKFNLESLLNQL